MTGSRVTRPVWLVDANVWLALSVPAHVHYAAAWAWLGTAPGSLGLCRVTQLALLRHLTNRTIMQTGVLTVEEAWDGLDSLRGRAGVIWLEEPSGVERLWRAQMTANTPAPGAWTDAYLAAFAIAHNVRLVSFDRGFARFPDLRVEIL